MLIAYMMGVYLAAILILSVLTYFISLRVTKVRQSFKSLVLANAFAVMTSALLAAILNVAEQKLPAALLFSYYKPILALVFSILIYGRCYSRRLKDIQGQNITPKLGYMIAGANISIILVVGMSLIFALSFFNPH